MPRQPDSTHFCTVKPAISHGDGLGIIVVGFRTTRRGTFQTASKEVRRHTGAEWRYARGVVRPHERGCDTIQPPHIQEKDGMNLMLQKYLQSRNRLANAEDQKMVEYDQVLVLIAIVVTAAVVLWGPKIAGMLPSSAGLVP
jgi:hypothetical protein